MKALILLLAATPVAMASVDRSALPEADAPRVTTEMNNLAQSVQDRCENTVRQVRDDRGQPRLDRGTATPDDPLLIAAVDRVVNGCHVLVARNDLDDIRVPPANDAQAALLIPAR